MGGGAHAAARRAGAARGDGGRRHRLLGGGGGGGGGEARVCIICEEAPREVRFACGHALVCNGCLPVVVAQHNKCPTCARPFGAQPVVERGRHVRGAPTFVLPK